MQRKLGLNHFASQLIGIVLLLVLFCLGVVTSFYYTNHQILTNYTAVTREENERNTLMRVEMYINLARQAEQSFYAKQNEAATKEISNNIQLALQELEGMEHQEVKNLYETESNKFSVINNMVKAYQASINKELDLWRTRGFTRNEGVSLELRQAAYDGLRSRLSHYNTHGFQSLLDRMRWKEYEFYFYWSPKHVDEVQRLVVFFQRLLDEAELETPLSTELRQGIAAYERELLALSARDQGSSHEAVEDIGDAISTLLAKHTIRDFRYLLRSLLYYEMEYRELGRQQKHVEGIHETLKLLSERIQNSEIAQEDKESLGQALRNYQSAFDKLVLLDKQIAVLTAQTTKIVNALNSNIRQAVAQEEQIMEQIRSFTQTSNQRHNMINLAVLSVMVVLALLLVTRMVRRLAGKVRLIGKLLARIAEGDLNVSLTPSPEAKRDELDQITHDVGAVAYSLKETMSQLQGRNTELEVISHKLAKYLSPQVYASIFSGRQEVLIQSKRKKLTIFFSDIVGFTSTTDSMESEELTTLLNDYLNEMSKIALRHGGTIDKFIGDAIMIFFGDPESHGEKNDAIACVSMAIDMRDRLQLLRKVWREEHGFSRPFRIRIGITTGYCTVGNFGSNERMDYTIIGGTVNLASRLEHQAEPDTILISHETYALVKERIQCTPQAEIQVKGIAHPVSTYRVERCKDPALGESLQLELSGEGFAVQVDGNRIAAGERNTLALQLEEMAQKLRQQA
ncbi:adenylate/guanylate cyclase [Magnetococcus marinus MC-1]|uniref:Adenylate/guanylate cyclase n=1 Tax=Magnetococcus marinus (strain ATCC BAA-1437 / JCM 17883 / MC-1) TaxID=156889 RepID=A0L8N6_MAGMM|nr:adenylate/guanylate cyclase domain-containing protein [Magnetococcus marinus]ABK44329.1 adenylate/guanylate cyclase [Magnetococcus marinus MC-1]